MKKNSTLRAQLLNRIPSSRYRIANEDGIPPKEGDVVTLDQGFSGPEGHAMVLVYFVDENGKHMYEAEVYESELGPNL